MKKVDFAVIGFATFGAPNDFRQSILFENSNSKIYQSLKVFDLSSAIKIFPNSTLYSIRKESISKSRIISLTHYSFAQEKESKRDGTFIGNSLVFNEYLPDFHTSLAALDEFHYRLKELNVENNVLKINHSKDFIHPKIDINKIFSNSSSQYFIEIPKFETNENQGKILVFYQTDEIAEMLNESMILFDHFNEVFFTSSYKIAAHVREKNLYKIIHHSKEKPQLDQYIKHIKKEKAEKIAQYKRNIQSRIAESQYKINQIQKTLDLLYSKKQQEKKSIDSDTSKLESSNSELQSIKKDLSLSFEALLNGIENSSLNLNLKKESSLIQSYTNQLNEISDFIERLNSSGRRNDDARSHHIPKPRVKTPSEVDQNNDGFGYNLFEYISIFLGVLLIGSWCYFLFFYEPDVQDNYIDQQVVQDSLNSNPVQEYLNESDLTIVNNKLKRGMTLDSIVSVIFNNNPKDIESHYSTNKELYKDLLLKSNTNLFKKENLEYILDADALKKVPCKRK